MDSQVNLSSTENEVEKTVCDGEVKPVEEFDPRAEIRALRKARRKKVKTPKELAALKKEEITAKRKAAGIHVQGSDIPPPVET